MHKRPRPPTRSWSRFARCCGRTMKPRPKRDHGMPDRKGRDHGLWSRRNLVGAGRDQGGLRALLRGFRQGRTEIRIQVQGRWSDVRDGLVDDGRKREWKKGWERVRVS